jgi:WD40 repeat protein
MLLTGHGDQVFTMRFNPAGDVIASGSHDKHVFLWRTYGECENYMMIKGALAVGEKVLESAPIRSRLHGGTQLEDAGYLFPQATFGSMPF